MLPVLEVLGDSIWPTALRSVPISHRGIGGSRLAISMQQRDGAQDESSLFRLWSLEIDLLLRKPDEEYKFRRHY